MNKQISVWIFIAQTLQQDIAVMLLYVLESKGSSPGRQGFFMAVDAKGNMHGSIGGGMMEHKFAELAKEKLLASGHTLQTGTIRKQVHDKSAVKNQSGMICSGEQTILLYPVQKKDADTIERIIGSLKQHRNGTLLFSPAGIGFEETVPEKDMVFTFQSENDWQYKEKTGYKNKLFIIGGGHCGLALSRLMQSMDFYTCLYDNRKELKTMVENDTVHEKYFIHDYTELAALIPPGTTHYVVIMTFGYRTDDTALRALLHKPFRYIGVLGSKKKMEQLFDQFRQEDIAGEILNKIHTPIGLAINSQTPEEIAVSIAAEIIRVKNQY
jgi:xanthine dehydrogenase accessory factor